MATDDVFFGGSGQVYVGPENSVVPLNALGPVSSAFTNVGLISEDGAHFVTSRETTMVRLWPSLRPNRAITISRTDRATFSMLELTPESVLVGYGGGAWTEIDPTTASNSFQPLLNGQETPITVVIDTADGENRRRIVINRAEVITAELDVHFTGTNPAQLAVELLAVPDVEEVPWRLYEASLARVALVLVGEGEPSDDIGYLGSEYYDELTGILWQKVTGGDAEPEGWAILKTGDTDPTSGDVATNFLNRVTNELFESDGG